MKLNMIRRKNDTEDLLLSISKIFGTLIKRTHTKPQETLDIKMVKPRETIHFNPTLEVKEFWMIGLVDLEVYNSFFNKSEENNKFKLYNNLNGKSVSVSY